MAHPLLEFMYRAQGSRLTAMERIDARMRVEARKAVQATIDQGAEQYDRARVIPKLIRMSSDDLALPEPYLTRRIICRLDGAIEAQRGLHVEGHWRASTNRLIALKQARAGEDAILARLESAARDESRAAARGMA